MRDSDHCARLRAPRRQARAAACQLCLTALAAAAAVGCEARQLVTGDAGLPADAGVAADAGWARTGTVTVTVGTWNIEQFPKTGTTSRAVSELLVDLDADLIGIQEIYEPAAFEALVARTPGWSGIRVKEPYDFLAVGLVYRPDRIRIVDSRPIFTDDPYGFPRPPLWAEVEALDDEGRVVFDFEFLVVHLKALRDRRSQDRRARAIAALDGWIRQRQASQAEQDFVVVGDWNDRLEDVREDNVFLPMLLAEDRYRFLTRPLAEIGEATYILIPGVIDHIMITTDALPEYGPGTTRVLYLEQIYRPYISQVSDHRPVLSTFVVR